MKDLWAVRSRQEIPQMPHINPYEFAESIIDITGMPSIGDLIDKLIELENEGELNDDDW